jgi:hypothetical protein
MAIVATIVALPASIPAMVVGDVAAIAFPATCVVLPIEVIRLDPVRALIRRTCPVAVVPHVVATLRILIAFDPQVIGAGTSGDDVRPRRRRLADVDAEGHLCVDRRGGDEEQRRDCEDLAEFCHN